MSDLEKILDQLVAGKEEEAKQTFHSMVVQQSRDAYNKLEQPVEEAVDKSALRAWYEKYNKYMGNNGDKLADGFFEAYLDTGILTDATETNEFAKAVDDVFGGDTIKAEEELFGNENLKKKHLPITYAMHDEFEKIMGAPVGATSPEDMEDNVSKAAKILGLEEGMNMEEADGGKKEQLKAWYDKYSKYEGHGGDVLPSGLFLGYMDSGILLDGVEENEFANLVKHFGGDRDEAEDKVFNDEYEKFLPITTAMREEFMKIMGTNFIDEDLCRKASEILGDDVVGFGIAEDDGGEKEQLKAWYDKYSKYEGTNNSNLVLGMIKAWTDTGILSDAYEDGEWADYLNKLGKDSDELSDEEFDAFLTPENAPISYGMQADITKIMGEWDGEETMNKVDDMLQSMGIEF